MSSEQRLLMTLATQVGAALSKQQLKLVTAESCTGGGVAQAITMISGSSQWFERGYVTYSNEAKVELLDVQTQTLDQFGAVSEQVAQQMAQGALQHSHAQVSIATTGIAGPEGGSHSKPVGMVCFAWAFLDQPTISDTQYFAGSRLDVQHQAIEFVLQKLVDITASC
jgi:nicotinamide-nucleotide amidase